jgi:hypothetical protein
MKLYTGALYGNAVYRQWPSYRLIDAQSNVHAQPRAPAMAVDQGKALARASACGVLLDGTWSWTLEAIAP